MTPRRLVALVDGSAFYVSCERVFDPSLIGVPVAVLSNNDGCVIARSQEVKDAGVRMGEPFFKCRRQLADMGARVYSSNYTLVCLAERHLSTPEASGAAGGVACITQPATWASASPDAAPAGARRTDQPPPATVVVPPGQHLPATGPPALT